MSQFSAKLKRLVEASGVTIYQLSKHAALDRTTIQRSISGERLPGPGFVEKLCDFLRVSPQEREDLLQHYSICRIGEQVYAGRKYIEKILVQIAGLHIYRSEVAAPAKNVTPGGALAHGIKVFEGQYSVNQVIRNVLEDEAYNSAVPGVSLTVPFSFRYLFDCLKQLYWESDGNISIQHVIAFSKNPHNQHNPNINLEVLSDVLPFAFCMGSGYQPHYYYAASLDTEEITRVMPFYFYTQRHLVTLSADFNTAIVYSKSDVLSVYEKHFQGCLARSFPLVQQLSCLLDMIVVGFGEVMKAGQVTHVMEPQPCFARYYEHDMVETYMHPELPNREEMKVRVCGLYDHYKGWQVQSFFTSEGLRLMAETGIMADLPQSFVTPFHVEDRIRFMKLLRDDIQSDAYFSRVIDTSKLQISHVATTQLYSDQSVLFMATTDRGMVACMIREPSICAAFLDFFQSLSDSKLLYSKTDTLKVIDECIALLETGDTFAE